MSVNATSNTVKQYSNLLENMCTTVKDETGRDVSVFKWLKGFAECNFEHIANNKELVKLLEEQLYQNKKQMKKQRLELFNFFENNDVVSINDMTGSQRKEYMELQRDYTGSKFNRISLNNRIYSALMRIFDLTLSVGKFIR